MSQVGNRYKLELLRQNLNSGKIHERRVRDMKNLVASVIAKSAKSSAVKSANSVCGLYFYLPKEPQNVKKLRKF